VFAFRLEDVPPAIFSVVEIDGAVGSVTVAVTAVDEPDDYVEVPSGDPVYLEDLTFLTPVPFLTLTPAPSTRWPTGGSRS